MKQRPDIIIAIDPDVERSGVAVLDTRSRRIELHTFPFPVLMDYLRDWKEAQDITHEPVRVVVEAGWLNKAHWHLTARDTARQAAAKGKKRPARLSRCPATTDWTPSKHAPCASAGRDRTER